MHFVRKKQSYYRVKPSCLLIKIIIWTWTLYSACILHRIYYVGSTDISTRIGAPFYVCTSRVRVYKLTHT